MGTSIHTRSRNAITGEPQAFYDDLSQETVALFSPAVLDEDFIGPAHPAAFPTSPVTGYPWVAKLIKTAGSPTVGAVANAAGGVVACALDATAEPQEAILYAGDALGWDASKSVVFECRLALSVLPTAGNVEMVWGLRSAYVAGPDNAAAYIDFQALGSGAVNVRIKDGVSSPQSVATGMTLSGGAFHNFRCDATDPTNVQFWIDGTKVSPVPPRPFLTFAATGANAILQPYFETYKPAGTGLATMEIDMVQLGMARS